MTTVTSSVSFQFHKVRLKVHVSMSLTIAMCVSIPQGTIKSGREFATLCCNPVSIPQGTIKSKSLELREVKDKPVSIPQGTIKRESNQTYWTVGQLFQFHKVRLKEQTIHSWRSYLRSFNSTRYD